MERTTRKKAAVKPVRRGLPAPPGHDERGRVLTLTPERVLHTASKRFLETPPDRCPKCGSTFVGREPAFLHCYYCGKMARIAEGSLADQELFELRCGLRLAS
ncbi:MAG: hypothetical protein ACREJG_13375 [Candidatus Rokuibacteriota bacterium]